MTAKPLPAPAADPVTALIVVDLQHGTTRAPTAHPIEPVIANAARLTAAFRAAGLPVMLASVDGTPPGRTAYADGATLFPDGFATLVAELAARPDEVLPVRRTWSAFAGTALAERLHAAGAERVVIAGLATAFGVESTARTAYDLGFEVVVATDAITDRSREAHEHTVARVLPALGRTLAADAVLELLAR